MPQPGDCDAASVIRRLSRRSCSTRTTKLRIVQDGRTRPEDVGRIAHMHAALRRRTRVGGMEWEDVRRLADSGLISHAGDGAPTVTPVGRWSATAAELGISFFEMCVLAKVYGVARNMAGAGGVGAGKNLARTATVPLKTIQYFFEDWPVYPKRIHHALSRLRSRGLIPRSLPKRIICDIEQLDAIRDELSEVDRWVDDTGEEMRRVLLHGD